MAEDNGFKLALALEDRIMRGDLGGLEILVALQMKRLMIRSRKKVIEQRDVVAALSSKDSDNVRKAIKSLEKKGVIARDASVVRFTLATGENHRPPVEITGEDDIAPVKITGSNGENHRSAPVEITGNEAPKPAKDAGKSILPKLTSKTTSKKPPLPPEGDGSFEKFKAEYQRVYPNGKRCKEWTNAKKAWVKFKLSEKDLPVLFFLLGEDSKEWINDRGDFGPLPASWLGKARWNDDDAKEFTNRLVNFPAPSQDAWVEKWLQGKGTRSDKEFGAWRINFYARTGAGIDPWPETELWEAIDRMGLIEAFRYYRTIILEERRRKGVANG